jgi:hypothetical protein
MLSQKFHVYLDGVLLLCSIRVIHIRGILFTYVIKPKPHSIVSSRVICIRGIFFTDKT